MLTNSTITKRATLAAEAVVWQPSARYQDEAAGRVNCPSSSPTIGGGVRQGHAFRLEGVLGQDRRQNQI